MKFVVKIGLITNSYLKCFVVYLGEIKTMGNAVGKRYFGSHFGSLPERAGVMSLFPIVACPFSMDGGAVGSCYFVGLQSPLSSVAHYIRIKYAVS